jgi:heptosyltransferase-2
MTGNPARAGEETMKNLLIIKPGAIGDLLQLTPVIRALKEKYRDARISLVVSSPATASLFRHNPHVHETIVYDKRGEHRSLVSLLGLRRRLRRARYDMVLNFQRSNLKVWLLASAAFPCRLLVYHKAKDRVVHAVVNHLEVVAPLGIDPRTADRRLELDFGTDDGLLVNTFIAKEGLNGRPLVALNLGASHSVNRWPVDHFADLTGRLSRELGASVLLVGGGTDRELADAVLARLSTSVVDLVGHTSLLQLGAVLRHCAVVVSGDTGPMHIATAVGTRVVALFGAADPARTGPVGEGHRVIQARDVACVPCRSRKCANNLYLECMKKITVEEVFLAVSEMLKEMKK